MKNLIKEYYSALIEKAENYSGEVPYSPEDELLKIKGRIQAERQRKIRAITAAAASVVCVAIGISYIAPDKEPVKEEGLLFVSSERADSDNAVKTAELPVVGTLEDAAIEKVNTTAITESKSEVQQAPMYTHVPQITVPPMKKIEYAADYELPEYDTATQEEYYALVSTPMPQLEINENENIPVGMAMSASIGEGNGDSGEVWSEEEYFEYLGKNILDNLDVPSDLVKSEPEGRYMLRDENGDLINDSRTFSYANADRTRLLNITTSKSPISDTAYESTEINGIKVGVFDNHMSNSALLSGNGIYVSAEMYGLDKEELMGIIYSLAERMAL